jgi:hypothetical protein
MWLVNFKVMNQRILDITTGHLGLKRIAQIKIYWQSLLYKEMELEKNEIEGNLVFVHS